MTNAPLFVVKLLLVALVIFLGWRFVDSMKAPIEFTKDSQLRDDVIHAKMEKIKEAQDAYYRIKGYYADNFDSLLTLCRRDSFTIESKLLVLKGQYDEAIHGPNKSKYGDTAYYQISNIDRVSIFDSLFNNINFPVEELKIIPFSNGKEFYIASGEMSAAGGRYMVPTYEVTAPKKYYYEGLNTRFFDPNSGYQLGSVSEASTDIYPSKFVYYPE